MGHQPGGDGGDLSWQRREMPDLSAWVLHLLIARQDVNDLHISRSTFLDPGPVGSTFWMSHPSEGSDVTQKAREPHGDGLPVDSAEDNNSPEPMPL